VWGLKEISRIWKIKEEIGEFGRIKRILVNLVDIGYLKDIVGLRGI